jgi:hypothetical protein
MDPDNVSPARTLLFVPGHRSDRFGKPVNSGAGAMICDLEDAVGPESKAGARDAVVTWLDSRPEAMVRINSPGSEWFPADVEALVGRGRVLMLPQATTASVRRLTERMRPRSHRGPDRDRGRSSRGTGRRGRHVRHSSGIWKRQPRCGAGPGPGPR